MPTIDLSRVTPLGDKVLVRRYTKPPTTPKGLLVPDSYSGDETFSIWEVIAAGKGVEAKLGMKLRPDTIVYTNPMSGVHVGEDLYFLAAGQIINVVVY